MQLVLFKRIPAVFCNFSSLKGIFRLGYPTLGKIHSSAHPSYTKIFTPHIITLYIAEIRKFLYITKVY